MNATTQTDGDLTPLFLRHWILIVGCMMMMMSVCVDVNLALGYCLS